MSYLPSVSVPTWDIVNGIPTPAILRGTMDLTRYITLNGAILGTGLTTGQRQNNANVLQAAINTAVNNSKKIEAYDLGTIEINTANGIIIPATGSLNFGATWRGSATNTRIIQYYSGGNGAPIITIGDTVNGVVSNGLDIYGMYLQYGVSQTNKTSANALMIGTCADGRIGGINVSGINPAWDGIQLFSSVGGGSNYFFSMMVENMEVGQVQNNMFNSQVQGTGNIFQNIYLNNGGSGVYNPLNGCYLNFTTQVQTNEWIFEQLNCEWGATNCVILAQANFGLRFSQLHMEGIKLTGFSPKVFSVATATIGIESWDIIDMLVQTGNFTGSAMLFQDYVESSSNININNFSWINNAANNVNTSITLLGFAAGNNPDGDVTTLSINKGWLKDQAGGATFWTNTFDNNFQFDNNMPVSSTAFLAPYRWSSYEYGVAGSVLNRPVVYVNNAYTHYGQLKDAIIELASTGTYNVTLANTMGASGNQLPVVTNTVTFLRPTYTSGTVTIKNAGGTTLQTNASTTKNTFQFNGTNWVVVTPIN